jgi:itaconate CoA-transferase
LRRERSGEGAVIDVTMLEALGEWMGFPAYFTAYGGTAPPRSGAHHSTIVPYGPFRAGDGQTVFISVQNEREFAAFCENVLKKPALVRDRRFSSSPARQQNRDAMHAEIDEVFAALTADQILERLEAADIANARLNDMEQFWRHPQLAARGRWAKVGSSAGDVDALKPPFNLSGFEPRMDAIPALGEHSRKVLSELGYSEREVEALAASGVI